MLDISTQTKITPIPIVTGISFEEYLVKYDGQHAEWIGGEVITYMSASDRHQDLARFFTVILSTFVEEHDLGIIRTGPMSMRLSERGREPDIFFVANKHLSRLKPTYLDGAADLIIEIISPESRGRDRGDKFYEYEAAGVKEYWLIDYERKQAEFYVLGKDGIYQLSQANENKIYRSKALKNLELNVNWLWQKKLPSLLDVLKEWKMV
jgi:Uma2 family endonuclease